MWTGIDILIPIQEFRLQYPFLQDFFTAVSSKAVYLALPMMIAMAFFWYIDKRKGDIISLSFIPAMAFAKSLKYIIAQPRPWVLDPNIIEVPGANANGLSCPSGHTAITSASLIPASLMVRKVVSIVLIVILILVIAARLVLCAHTPLDIIVGLLVGLCSAAVAWKAADISLRNDFCFYSVCLAYSAILTIIAVIALTTFGADPADVATYMGFLYGMMIGRALEHRYVHYEVRESAAKDKAIGYLVGMIAGAAILAIPSLIIPEFGRAVGGFLMMLWCFTAYPYLLMRKDRPEGR
jgi:undecaprenyl-diphosphatase